MTWRTHLVGGLAAGTGTAAIIKTVGSIDLTSIESLVPIVVTAGISALLADVDEKNSKAGRALLPVSMVFWILQTFIKILSVFTFGKVKKRLKRNTKFLMHHGICHYPITLAVLLLIGFVIITAMNGSNMWYIILIAFTAGYLSHILLDLISGKIAIFFPISKKEVGLRIFKYNGTGENLIVLPALVIATIIMALKVVRL